MSDFKSMYFKYQFCVSRISLILPIYHRFWSIMGCFQFIQFYRPLPLNPTLCSCKTCEQLPDNLSKAADPPRCLKALQCCTADQHKISLPSDVLFKITCPDLGFNKIFSPVQINRHTNSLIRDHKQTRLTLVTSKQSPKHYRVASKP